MINIFNKMKPIKKFKKVSKLKLAFVFLKNYPLIGQNKDRNFDRISCRILKPSADPIF